MKKAMVIDVVYAVGLIAGLGLSVWLALGFPKVAVAVAVLYIFILLFLRGADK